MLHAFTFDQDTTTDPLRVGVLGSFSPIDPLHRVRSAEPMFCLADVCALVFLVFHEDVIIWVVTEYVEVLDFTRDDPRTVPRVEVLSCVTSTGRGQWDHAPLVLGSCESNPSVVFIDAIEDQDDGPCTSIVDVDTDSRISRVGPLMVDIVSVQPPGLNQNPEAVFIARVMGTHREPVVYSLFKTQTLL